MNSSNQNPEIKILFDNPLMFEPKNFQGLDKVCGLYFIFLSERIISYPFKDSKLIYIGMSEKLTNSISSRLSCHFDGSSKNVGISSFKRVDQLRFTYLNFESLRAVWSQRIEFLESHFIQDFVAKFGVYPICNNKTGFPDFDKIKNNPLEINWDYFTR